MAKYYLSDDGSVLSYMAIVSNMQTEALASISHFFFFFVFVVYREKEHPRGKLCPRNEL